MILKELHWGLYYCRKKGEVNKQNAVPPQISRFFADNIG